MTRDEILNMPAGREMDALIAENVLGWSWGGFEGGYQRLYVNDGEHRRYGAIREGGKTEYTNNLHNYSTDMGAAWEVVGKLSNGVFRLELGARKVYVEFRGYTNARVIVDGDPHEVAPLAICRAALLAATPQTTGEGKGAP